MTDELKLKMLVTCVDMADTYDEAKQMGEFIFNAKGANWLDFHIPAPTLFRNIDPLDNYRFAAKDAADSLSRYMFNRDTQRHADPAASAYVIFKDDTYRPWEEVSKELDKLDRNEVKAIGIRYRFHTFAISMTNLAVGETKLYKDGVKSYDKYVTSDTMIDAIYDFDMEKSNRLLRASGLAFGLGTDEYIPTLGMLIVMCHYRTQLNEILEHLKGELLQDEYWSSSIDKQTCSFTVDFFNGIIQGYVNRKHTAYIRPVMKFEL